MLDFTKSNAWEDLENFSISKNLVSYFQMLQFLNAKDGFSLDTWWEGLAVHKKFWDQENKNLEAPANNMNWYTAIAYCRWISNKLNQSIRLPTEQELYAKKDALEVYPNFWEWCINEGDDPKVIDLSSGRWKAVMGKDSRKQLSPINPYAYVGFRVVKERI